MNRYLTKIASDLAKAEQYEKSEKKEVRMYSKEEKNSTDPLLKAKLKTIIPQEQQHAKKFSEVVSEQEKKSSINIKPSHKGLLHERLGISPGIPISTGKLESAGANATGKLKKEIVFAKNARHWKR